MLDAIDIKQRHSSVVKMSHLIVKPVLDGVGVFPPPVGRSEPVIFLPYSADKF